MPSNVIYIKPFVSLSKSDAYIAGGKGASLGEMTQAGIPVPPGFVVLADAFEKFLEETDLNVEIDAILHKVNHKDINSVEKASKNIRELVLSAKIPEDIAKEIKKHFKSLKTKYVAVRSSATAEDGAAHSWAGQLDSFLNTTEKTLLINVQKCWASLFTPRAIFYRNEKDLHKTKISVAVVVQKMVESETAGIAFSVHPVTQDRNQIVIEAGYGLGEAVVSGQITPDSYVVEKTPKRIIDKNINKQDKGIYKKESGGNEWKDVEKDKVGRQVLSDKQILELSEIILKIEKHYGFPCDTEWVFEKGSFYIVQSRPITTLGSKEKNNQKNWLLNGEIFYWGPIQGHFFWVGEEFVNVCCHESAKKFKGLRWPSTLILLRDNRLVWLNEMDALKLTGKEIFVKYMVPNESWESLYNEWKNKVKSLLSFENKINEERLRSVSNEKLLKQWNELFDLLKEFWLPTIPAELGNYGAPTLLEQELKNYIKNRKELIKAMEFLTAPEKLSFYQQEEIDLYKSTDIQAHADKYFWLKNSYAGTQVLNRKFFVDRKKQLRPNIEKSLLRHLNKNIQRKKDIADRYNLPQSILHIAKVVSNNIEWQDNRKMYIFQYLHFKDLFIKEVSRRFHYEYPDLLNCWYTEIADIIKGTDLKDVLSGRRKGFAVYFDGSTKILSTEEALQNWSHYVDIKIDDVERLSGIVACSGKNKKFRGKVRVLFNPYDSDSFSEGEILVAPMTTPEYVFVMKKSKAVITDAGGLTSHAAIVSRELNITCIVGTKHATKLLKDGDLIEVDANNGVVKILKKAGNK
jgi:phosphohistidine swiveling domain-containing protein